MPPKRRKKQGPLDVRRRELAVIVPPPKDFGDALVEVPHDGLLAVDRGAPGSARCMLVHLLTHERQSLPPGGQWEVIFDEDDGSGCVFDSTNVHRPILAEDLLRMKVKRQGRNYIVETERAGQPLQRSLTAKMRAFCAATCCVPVETAMRCEAQLHLFRLQYPRQGFEFAWSLLDLYSKLRMTEYGREPSKWAYDKRKSLAKNIKLAGLNDEHLILSAASADEEDVCNTTAFLPAQSLTTAGLFANLARWCGAVVQHGGLRRPEARDAARQLLESIALASNRHRDRALRLRFVDAWEPSWPCYEPCAPDLVLPIGHDGLVGLDPAKAFVASKPAKAKATVANALLAQGRSGKAKSADMLCSLVALPGAQGKSLFGQAVYQLARYVEISLAQALRSVRVCVTVPPSEWNFVCSVGV